MKSVITKVYSNDPKKEDSVKLYSIFYTGGNMTNCVPFLNTYHYTVYVPSNEAIRDLYENEGLPTWDMIVDESNNNPGKAISMIRLINSFARYHFQDQSVFVDNVTAQNQYQTSCIDNVTNSYLSLNVIQSPSALSVLDRSGNTVDVVASEENRNLLARDICYNAAAASASYIKNSSYVVIHQIDGYLNYNSDADYEGLYFEGDETKNLMPKGRFDFWNYAKPEQLESYVAKYRLR